MSHFTGTPRLTDDDILARLLYRDGMMLVVDKPAGVPVHAGPKGGPSLEASFDALRFGLPGPPYLAHRLDRDTSGCLVLGRHAKALAKLGKMFAGGRITKTYWAVVEGTPPAQEGRIDQPLRKLNKVSGWRVAADPSGQPATTLYRVLGRHDNLTWVELSPLTGRTHQLRAHMALLGCPILGDENYGPIPGDTGGRMLHLLARSITIPLYDKRPPIIVTAPVPAHMLEALTLCGFREVLTNKPENGAE